MKNWSKWLLSLLLFSGMWLLNLTNVQAATTIEAYDVHIKVSDDGVMQSTETINYHLSEETDVLKHQLDIGANGDLTDLQIDIKENAATNYFPFGQSNSKAVGTYTSAEKDKMMYFEAFNNFTKGDHEAKYIGKVADSWINYPDGQVLEMSFINAPMAVDTATITFDFPKPIDPNAFKFYQTTDQKVTTEWLSENQLQIKVKQIAEDQNVAFQMVLPADALANNQTKGPESQGKQIIQDINNKIADNQAQQKRYQWLVYLISASLLIASVALMGYLLWVKNSYNKQVTKYPKIPLEESSWTPLMVSTFLKQRFDSNETLWLVLLDLLQKGKVNIQFDKKEKHLANAQIRIEETHDLTRVEQQLINSFQTYIKNNPGEEISLRDWQYSANSKGKLRTSAAYKRVMRQIKRVKKQQVNAQSVYLKRNQLYRMGCFLLTVLSLVSIVLIVYWQIQQGIHSLVALIMLLLSIIVIMLTLYFVLPIRNITGVQWFKNFRKQIKAMNADDGKQAILASQSVDRLYLYTWLLKTNQKSQNWVTQSPQTVPLYRALQPVKDWTLTNLKIKP